MIDVIVIGPIVSLVQPVHTLKPDQNFLGGKGVGQRY